MDYKYSPWGNNVLGVFLKGKNGNNLYLPFSGFKSGVKVNNKSEGCFLSSDAVDSDNNLQRKAVVIKNNDAIWHSTDALAYGYSVRPVSAGSDGLVIEPQQLDYEVIVGQKVGQSVTVTNNGSAPVSVTVTQTTAPFQVDNACLGTFTVSPKKQQSVLVYFSPTEEKEYTSVLTLSYEKGSTRVVSKVSLKGKGVNSSNIPLKLSATTLTLTAGQQGTVNITSGSGSYAAVSNATNVATVTVEGSKLIIKAVAKGAATITVKDNQTQERAKIEVTVKASEVITPGTAIDLGLPSGTLWASCNVGATKPEDFGNYYAWGETEEKDYYYWDNYMCEESECGTTKDPVYTWNGNKLYADIAGSKFDVATSKWGSSWHMPSSTQMDELLNECIWTWCDGDKTKYNGTNVKGYIISSKVNNNKIFLPAAGNYHKDEILYKNESCLYWSSSQFDGSPFEGEANYTNSNSAMGMDYNNKATYTDLRYYGQTIRPVMNAQQPTIQTETITIPGTNVSFKMIGVEGGTFWMGSADDDSNAEEDEKPRHQVTLSDFSIGETEVTQELWETVMGEKDSYSRGPNYPKCNVSMEDCEVFIGKLISLTGRNFRLPTEAEWEYAAKGGNKSKGFTYSGSNNANDVAWFTGNSGNKIHEVATKSPNELGVYDMSGNAQEWCSDFYDDDYYSSSPLSNPIATYGSGSVYRGGDWNDELKEIRVCNRGGGYYSYGTRGLRLVLTNDNEGIINSPICPDEHHPHMIDLGLPSGIKWACCNVGATSPNNYGGYYCWGEIEEKGEIGWGSYTHSDGRWDNVHYLGDISGTQYDVANVKWGDNWVMPSKENFKELIENCSSKWIRLFGIKGRIFTGLNGLSIFFPANDGFYRIGEYGSYWSSKQIDGYMDAYWGWLVDKAHYLYFDEDESRVYSDGLLQLNGVRPIRLN
jgi:formylglycine-generating enzyme required for sulfatase activity